MRNILILCSSVLIFFNLFAVRKVYDMRVARERKTSRTINRILNSIFDSKSCNYLRKVGIDIDSRAFRRKNVSEKIEYLAEKQDFRYDFYLFPKKKKEIMFLASTCITRGEEYNGLKEFCIDFLGELFDNIEDLKTYKMVEKYMNNEAKRDAYRLWFRKKGVHLITNDIFTFYNLGDYFFSELDDAIKFDLALFFEHFQYIDDGLHRTSSTPWEFEHNQYVVDKDEYQSLKIVNYLWDKLKIHFKIADIANIRSNIYGMNTLAMPEGIAYCCSYCCFNVKKCWQVVYD